MPRFHALFSLGHGGRRARAARRWSRSTSPSPRTCWSSASGRRPSCRWSTRRFADDHAAGDEGDAAAASGARASLDAWRERRTLLIGVFVLAFAFAEGAGNDWIGVALIEDHGAEDAVGTLALAAFLAAMTAGPLVRALGARPLGPGARHPRARRHRARGPAAVRRSARSTGSSFVGTMLWGVGISLGFPVGMSAAADDPARAAPRVSVVSSIGYCAFLAGPPLIGFLGHQDHVLHALSAVIVLLAVAALVAGNVRPLVPPNR